MTLNAHNQTSHELTDWIKSEAIKLGFDRVGVLDLSQPRSPSQSQSHGRLGDAAKGLLDWLAQGYQAEMHWMENHLDKRIEAGGIMDNAQSVVCVAINYHQSSEHQSSAYLDVPFDSSEYDAIPKVAQYARGRDYHKVIRKKLTQLLKIIQTRYPEVTGRSVTDSAPQMERPMAVEAGLGWTGKNGCLIHPAQGSYYFLGELILTLPLEGGSPFEANHCGSCTRCIDACPTDAIVAPSVIDSNKCISYWTIESDAEAFPKEIQSNLKGWVFGCDICQDVCPWNERFAKPTEVDAFQPKSAFNEVSKLDELHSLLSKGEAYFNKTFEGNPLRRTGYTGLKRNVQQAFSTE